MTGSPSRPQWLSSDSLDENLLGSISESLMDQPYEARGLIGIARRDITPPLGSMVLFGDFPPMMEVRRALINRYLPRLSYFPQRQQVSQR